MLDLTGDESSEDIIRERRKSEPRVRCFVPLRRLGWGHYQQFVSEEGFRKITCRRQHVYTKRLKSAGAIRDSCIILCNFANP